jgi:hypothetical protein
MLLSIYAWRLALIAWLHAVTGLKLVRTSLIVYSQADQRPKDWDLHG